jgi:GntR family transcriptional regulator
MEGNRAENLQFTLDPKSGVPFYKQIILQIEMAIAGGRLMPGSKLPTVRSLAVELQINPNTVARAYSELEIRQILDTEQGTGTFISNRKVQMTDIERERILAELSREFISKVSSYGFSVTEIAAYFKELADEEGAYER